MIRHRWKLLLSLLLSLVFLVIVVVLIKDWAVETPAEQLDQKIQPQPTPEYKQRMEVCSLGPQTSEYYDGSCRKVFIKISREDMNGIGVSQKTIREGPEQAALISEDFARFNSDFTDVTRVSFYYDYPVRSLSPTQFATSYCFASKDLAVSALRGELDKAQVLGKTENCYVTVYKFLAPDMELP